MKPHLALTQIALIGAAPPAAHNPGANRVHTAVYRAMTEQGDIVTPADYRAIALKCGLPAGRAPRTITFDDGGLTCPDGRVVRDAETRAMSDRIAGRAGAVASAALDRPEVVAAVEAYADAASIAAIRRLRNPRR